LFLEVLLTRSALLIIDMQNDLAHPDGTMFVPDAAHRLDVMEGLQSRFREAGAPVIHVIRSHRSDGWDAERFRTPMFTDGSGMCVEQTWGMQPVDRLYPQGGEPVVLKRRFSGFLGTELDLLLRRARIEKLVVSGVSLHASVRQSAVDAVSLDYDVVIAEDAVATAVPDTRHANLMDLRALGCRIAPADDLARETLRASEHV
jgi:nicotinamidase-related amidase